MTDEEKKAKTFSEPFLKKEIKSKLGISDENFSFYMKSGYIRKSQKKRTKFEYALEMHDMILERGTVFKYCFEDSFIDDTKEFMEVVKHTGKCKTYTRDELDPEYVKRLEEEMSKRSKKKSTHSEYDAEKERIDIDKDTINIYDDE